MIIEIATAAAMYVADATTATAAESDIPPLRPLATQQCRYRDNERIRQCLMSKMQQQQDPYAAMWDPNWVSAITYDPKDIRVSDSGSAKAGPRVLPKSHKTKQ